MDYFEMVADLERSVIINMPFPPSTNNLFINVTKGRIPSARYADWRQAAGWSLKAQHPRSIRTQNGPKSLRFGPHAQLPRVYGTTLYRTRRGCQDFPTAHSSHPILPHHTRHLQRAVDLPLRAPFHLSEATTDESEVIRHGLSIHPVPLC